MASSRRWEVARAGSVCGGLRPARPTTFQNRLVKCDTTHCEVIEGDVEKPLVALSNFERLLRTLGDGAARFEVGRDGLIAPVGSRTRRIVCGGLRPARPTFQNRLVKRDTTHCEVIEGGVEERTSSIYLSPLEHAPCESTAEDRVAAERVYERILQLI